jgi:hypothetical protein
MHRAVRTRRNLRGRSWLASIGAGVAAGVAVGALIVITGAVSPIPAARADTSSAVTVSANQQDTDIANAPMPDLKVTVSQTRDLLAQGIQISWTGGKKSEIPTPATGGTDFLQIMQCWGDDPDGGPDRTTCQYGGFGTPGAYRYSTNTDYETVDEEDQQYTAKSTGPFSPNFTGIPFKSATGELVESVHDNVVVPGVDPSTNQFFTRLTTNEVSWAGSSSDGSGSAKFELQTAAESPGLGCGKEVRADDGSITGAACWLVIIPRGEADPGKQYIVNSGLAWSAWKHRIAIPLGFQPIGARCLIGAAERQLAGSELISDAVRSWQPQLCGAVDGAAYSLIGQTESDAAVVANGAVAAPMALTSRALRAEGVKDSLQYAPVALTGLAISFAVDRQPSADGNTPDDALDRARLPFTELKLTPRLVAKLLTNSYVDSLPNGADRSEIGYNGPLDPGSNARNLTSDPDFLAINDPEWAYQAITSPAVADLLTPLGRLDSAWAVWSYVIADPEARAFLNGEPDPWNMIVNPWSRLAGDDHPDGTTYPLDNFPRADPIEQPAVPGPDGAGPVNLVTWRPYTNNLDQSANLTLRGDGQLLGGWDVAATPPKYGKAARNVPGLQAVLGLTDTAAAAKYQVYTASLRNPAGEYVLPDSDSLTAAAAAMTVDPTQPQVYGFDPTSDAAHAATNAYPLAMPVYAAVNPAMADSDDSQPNDEGPGELRADYASFIEYAVTNGQGPGTGLGQLPSGYAPLPQGWRNQALSAAAVIQSGPQKPAQTPRPTAAPKPPAPQAAPPAVVPPAVPGAQPPSNPSASGQVAGSLSGTPTAADKDLGLISAAVPISIAAGLLAALAVSFLTRIRRRL